MNFFWWYQVISNKILSAFSEYMNFIWPALVKVQLFWEEHKNLKKSSTCFDANE